MIASGPEKTQVLSTRSVWDKLARLDGELEVLARGPSSSVPEIPGRDVQIVSVRALPDKKGLSTGEGQARLLHDLASIELQAMELGLRTLIEYPEAPAEFRAELIEVTRDEGRHLRLCLEALVELGQPWGSYPAHIGLWRAVRAEDALLDRILIVHRYLEGSGLDASETILRRLAGVKAHAASRAVGVIRRDELGHVRFGSRWYHKICLSSGLDAAEDFGGRLARLATRLPTRREPLNADLRAAAGFLPGEIEALRTRLHPVPR